MKTNLEILVKTEDPELLPEIIENGDWIDLRVAEDVTFSAPKLNLHTNEIDFDFKILSLGVAIKVPKGYECHAVPRSSLFKKHGLMLANSMGVIDNSYSGNNDIWKFPALALRDTTIPKGERICQFRIVPTMKSLGELKIIQVDKLDDESRGGIGSTGRF